MSTTFRATPLHVTPPSRAVADTDRMALVFSAGEAITDGTATLAIINPYEDVSDLIVSTTVDTDADAITVVVAGLTRGVAYELAVVFERADTTAWTRLLVLQCVA